MTIETTKLPDEMGVHSDAGDVVWLPREYYPKRIQAIQWAMAEWGCHFLDVRCRSRQMKYAPEGGEDLWSECDKDDLDAFPVWRLEGA